MADSGSNPGEAQIDVRSVSSEWRQARWSSDYSVEVDVQYGDTVYDAVCYRFYINPEHIHNNDSDSFDLAVWMTDFTQRLISAVYKTVPLAEELREHRLSDIEIIFESKSKRVNYRQAHGVDKTLNLKEVIDILQESGDTGLVEVIAHILPVDAYAHAKGML